MTKKILIGGDSWGCGEWGFRNNKYGVLHAGLEQYLLDDGFVTTNVSRGGSNNKDAIRKIAKELEDNTYDHVIWFQSDPIRDLRPYNNFCTLFQTRKEFMKLRLDLLTQSYQQLNQLDKKVVCVGGCANLDPSINAYSNLVPAVNSMIELLIPGLSAPDVWISDWIKVLNTDLAEEVLDFLMHTKKQQDAISSYKYSHLFFPDGGHPNRNGHLILYNFIKENFLNKNY